MIQTLKLALLRQLRQAGVYQLVSQSQWRNQRLLVLCYHGVSLEDEHEWNGGLYIPFPQFERRMQHLRENGYRILSLQEGLERVRRGDLPERSVAITFDDGMYDFYAQAWPVLQQMSAPVTVYLTTYHCGRNFPIFRLACLYLLWKQRRMRPNLKGLAWCGDSPVDLSTAGQRQTLVYDLDRYAKAEGMTGEDKQGLVQRLAERLEFDLEPFLKKRMLQIMNPEEVRLLATQGVDIQMHTHRHRTPLNPALFRREVEENQVRITALTGIEPKHFCYPSGYYSPRFLPWLEVLGVESAVTCDYGFVNASSDWRALPRMLDHTGVSDLEFEGWLTGLRALLPSRKLTFRGDPESISDSGVWSGAPG